jgi:hypothetical protein
MSCQLEPTETAVHHQILMRWQLVSGWSQCASPVGSCRVVSGGVGWFVVVMEPAIQLTIARYEIRQARADTISTHTTAAASTTRLRGAHRTRELRGWLRASL